MGAESAPDRCPRCGGGFACGAAGSAPCACTTLVLPPALLAALRARFDGCLCLDCLHALAAGGSIDPPRREAPGADPRTA